MSILKQLESMRRNPPPDLEDWTEGEKQTFKNGWISAIDALWNTSCDLQEIDWELIETAIRLYGLVLRIEVRPGEENPFIQISELDADELDADGIVYQPKAWEPSLKKMFQFYEKTTRERLEQRKIELKEELGTLEKAL